MVPLILIEPSKETSWFSFSV